MLQIAEGTEVRFFEPDYIYRKNDGVSQSELKEMLRSAAHWAARYGPDAQPTFPSAAMIMGTALHAKVLEPETFDKNFVDRGSKPKELTITELKAALEDQQIEFKKTAKKPELEALLYPDGKPVDKRGASPRASLLFQSSKAAVKATMSKRSDGFADNVETSAGGLALAIYSSKAR